jgi:hypothetical protein
MTPGMRTRLVLAACLIAVGIGFASLPDTWIEKWFGFELDGGNGWIEDILTAATSALGVGLVLQVFLRDRLERDWSVGSSHADSKLPTARL